MEHYLAHTDYPIWEVIQNGNGPVSISTDTQGQIKVLPSRTAKEILAKERERKARTTLLMALPEDHLAKFHKMTDAKEMWEAIKSRFRGNDESKKIQKYILKQQFEGFSVSNSEELHKGYDMFQSLRSQLEIHDAGPVVDSLSFDDLYNNLRVFESDVKETIDGEVLIDQSRQQENYALMACSSSGSDTEVTSCSKECKESYAKLKKLYDEQREQLGDASIEIQAYTQALKKVEAQLVAHQQSQLWYEEKIRFMKIDLDDKTDVLTYHKKLLVEAEKEKKELKAKVEKWHNSFKNLNILLNSQISARDKAGLGYGDQMNKGVLSYENEVFQSMFVNRTSDIEDSHVNDRYAEAMHAVPPPMTGIYIPSGPDKEIDDSQFTYGPKQSKPSESDARSSDFNTCESNCSEETYESMPEPVVNEPKVVSQPKVWSDAPIIEEYESDSEDEHVSLPIKEQKTPSLGYGFTKKACFVCGSFSRLIRDCDFHEKMMAKQAELNNMMSKGSGQREIRPVWNNVQRVNHQNQFVPKAVLTRTGKIQVNTTRTSGTNTVNTARHNFNRQAVPTNAARKVNTVKPIVNNARPKAGFHKTLSPFRKPFNRTTTLRTNFSYQKVNTAEVNAVSAVGGKRETAVKPSAGCNWRHKRHYWNKVSKYNGGSSSRNCDYPQRALQNKGIVDSGCSRHMTGNKAYLAEYQDFNGGPVAFGGSKGYITGKGKIKTGKLDFEDVCFVKELQHFNLFSVSQMCDKKNKVLFTDTTALTGVRLVLSLTKDETSGILKDFIRQIKNQLNLKVKSIRSDNGTEFKNRDFIEFGGSKGIKRAYSNARTPQQNGVAERKNRTLIEAAITMLADSFLPNTFWAEVVSTACYVLNRVLVTKPQNKTPYELITGKIPIISYIRPFGCHVTILNTIDHLGKFDGKSDEGFLVGSENQANKHAGPQEANHNAGTEDNIDAGDSEIEAESAQDYFVLPIWSSYTSTVKSSKANNVGEEPTTHPDFKPVDKEDQVFLDELERLKRQEHDANNVVEALRKEFAQETKDLLLQAGAAKASSTNIVNTASTPVSIVSPYGGLSFTDLTNTDQDDLEIPSLEKIYDNPTASIFTNASYDDEGAVADFTNLETIVIASPIPTSRINSIHPSTQILRDLKSAVQTRSKVTKSSGAHAFILVDLPYGKKAIGTKWVYRNKKDERGVVVRNKARLVAQGHRQEEGYDYVEFLLYGQDLKPLGSFRLASYMGIIDGIQSSESSLWFTPSSQSLDLGVIDLRHYDKSRLDESIWESSPSYLGLQVKTGERRWYLYKSMIGSLMYLTASRPDIMFAVCACSRFQVNPKTSHLSAVKRIFRYLKGKPKLGLWYPRVSSFDLEAYSDSDYARANLDRKSTTRGCQFLGRRLISWQCKKQTIVATSTTEAEYVAAANCCGQVLWIQNQMLDYGFNFMNTKIYIDNESTICIVKNPVFHSKTKHIAIRHHFIRDAYEKKLIQVLKIHTDDNVADLLTKAFDVSRESLERDINGTEELLLPDLFIFWLTKVSTDSAKLIPLGKDSTAIKTLEKIPPRLKNVPVPLDHFPINALTSKVFSFMVKKGKHFSGKVTPLFPNMLVQPTEDEGEGSERPSEPQPIPSPPHPSTDQHETQTNPSPRPLLLLFTDSIPEGSGGNHGGQSSSDKSLSGNEGGMTLQSVYDLCISLCTQVTDQANEIKHLKAQIKKLKKKAKPVITHHRAWMKSVSMKQRLAGKKSLKKQWMQKEYVSKQGRKSGKAKPTVYKDSAFNELDDYEIDYMETEDAQDVGRTRYVVHEEKESAEKEVSTKDALNTDQPKVSTDRPDKGNDKQEVSTNKEEVSTDRPDKGTVDQTKGRSATPTTPTSTLTIFGDDETIAQVLLNMSQAKAVSREQGGKGFRRRGESSSVWKKSKLIMITVATKARFLAEQRAAAIKNRPPTRTRLRSQMMTYLKHMLAELGTKKEKIGGHMRLLDFGLEESVNLKSVEIFDLNSSLQEKVLVITSLKDDLRKLKRKALVDNDVTKHPSDPKMLNIDMEPITPKLLNKKTAHTAYIKHTQEEATVLKDLVEHVKLKYPQDQSLESACRYAKRIQELLTNISKTCPSINNAD
ncbi:putative ribonuclease H-like domain-containing protein [Tanacetum coccineum]